MKHTLKTLATSTALVTALFAAPSFAATAPGQSWYAGASGDLTWMGDSKTGGGGNADIGYRFNDWRVEGEIGYHDAAGRDGEHYWSYMGNAYYDFNNMYSSNGGWHVAPYIGGGLGDIEYGHDQGEFAYQGMAGVNFASASMPNTTYRLGYRYLGASNDSPDASNIELGVNVAF